MVTMQSFITANLKSEKKGDCLWLSPFLTIVLIAISFGILNLYPFGTRSIAWCDMNQQTIPLWAQCRDILMGKASFFYSNSASGMGFLGVFFFFCSSPFLPMVLLVEKSKLSLFINVIFACKLVLCSITAEAYFRRFSISRFFHILFSLIYTFGGYGLFYYQNFVWLDVMWMFPLLLLSLESLLQKGKTKSYILCFSAMLIIQYYLCYMLVIFLILAVGCYLIFDADVSKRKEIARKFVCSSILSVLLTSVVWLPCLIQYLDSARGGSLLESLQSTPIFDSFADKASLIYCTPILFGFIPLLVSKRIPKTLKALFILLWIPVFIDPINAMWHTGSYQAFPLRYGYINILLELTAIAIYLSRMEIKPSLKSNKLYTAFVSVGVFFTGVSVFWLLTFHKEDISSYVHTLWVNESSFLYHSIFLLISGVSYFLLLLGFSEGRVSIKMSALFFSVLFLFEFSLNQVCYIGESAFEPILYDRTMALENTTEEDAFYRVKTQKKYMHANMLGGLGYANLAHYTSLTDSDYLYSIKKLGYSSYWMEISGNGGTLLTDAFLSVKYSIGKREDFKNSESVLSIDGGTFELWKQPLSMPLGIVLPSDFEQNVLASYEGNRIQTQKELAEQLFQNSDFIQSYDPQAINQTEYEYLENEKKYFINPNTENGNSTLTYNITVTEKETLYFDLCDTISTNLREKVYDSVRVYVNGKSQTQNAYPNAKENGFLELGTFENETVNVKISVLKEIQATSFGVFGINQVGLQQQIERGIYADITQKDSSYYGTCIGKKGDYLLLSVCKNRGFSVYVNHKKTDWIQADACFMAIPLEEGENEIEIHYVPSGLYGGLFLSIFGILMCFVFQKTSRKRLKQSENLCNFALCIAFFVVLFVIYIFPLFVKGFVL